MNSFLIKVIMERILKTAGFGLILIYFNYLYPENANNLIELIGTAMIFIAAGSFPNLNIYAQKIANQRADDDQFNYFKFYFSLFISFFSFAWSQNIFLTLFIFTSIINTSAHILYSLETNKSAFNKVILVLITSLFFKLYFVSIFSNLNILLLICSIENFISVLIVRNYRLFKKIKIFNYIKDLKLKDELNLLIIGILYSLIINFDSQFISFEDSNPAEYFYFKKIFEFSIMFFGWLSFSLPKIFSNNNFEIIYFLKKNKLILILLVALFNITLIFLSFHLSHYLILSSGIIVIIFDSYVLRLEIFRKKTVLILIVYSFRLFCLLIFSFIFTNNINFFVVYFPFILYISVPVYFLCLKIQK